MKPRPIPRIWLMTDPRIDAVLLASARGLPPGSGIVLRHDRLPDGERLALFRTLRRIARRRGLTLFLKGDPLTARRWGADGAHLGTVPVRGCAVAPRDFPVSASVHDRPEVARARRAGAALLFLSPVHATRSHPEAAALGAAGLRRVARQSPVPVVALGGMTAPRGRMLARVTHGWAAIDGLAAPRASR